MTIKDRGTKKWTAMMLPEHVSGLRKIWFDDFEQTQRPELDEYEIEEIESKLFYALEFKRQVTIKIWDQGFFKEITGLLKKFNGLEKCIYLEEKDCYLNKIRFSDIVKVELAE